MKKISFDRFALESLPKEIFSSWKIFTDQNENFHSPFFSPYFSVAVAQADLGNCFVTVIYEEGKIIGYFPFQFQNKILGRAERIGIHLSDYNGVISAQPLSISQIQKMLKASEVHQYSFDHMHPSQENLGLCKDFIREGCAIDLTEGFASYWKALEAENSKIVKDTIRRDQKLAREIGPIEVIFKSENSQDLKNLIELKRKQYFESGVHDSLTLDWTRKCLENLHEISSEDFSAVLTKVSAGEKFVSYHFGLMAHGILHFWFPVYNPELSAYSPGRLLFYHLIQNSDKFGIKKIDRGMGSQKHKTDFANIYYKLGVGTLRRPTAHAFLLRGQDFIKNKISKAKSAKNTPN